MTRHRLYVYEKKFKLSYGYGKTVHGKILYKSCIPTFILLGIVFEYDEK